MLCAMRDTRVVRELRRKMEAECAFNAVRSGQDALSSALENPPDILIIDAVLSKLDGIGVIEKLQGMLGERMPRVIGGSVLSFADEAFSRCGVDCHAGVPWNGAQLEAMIRMMIREIRDHTDWDRAQKGHDYARTLLDGMGMNNSLNGYGYLAWAAALAGLDESRLHAIGESIYVPIAEREQTTVESVERLIRHAIERTADTVGEHGIYAFFGNTIDPMRGKPTNAQMIAMLAQRIRAKKSCV